MARLDPVAIVTEPEREAGLRLLIGEAAFSGSAAALTSGVVLTAFALHLGASSLMVGVLASIPFLAQLLQLPAILLVDRLRQRKRIAVLTSIAGRAMLAVMAATAFSAGLPALLVFLVAQAILCGLGAVGTCAWNSWLRDLAPERRMGDVFARRSLWLTAINLVLGAVAALALELTADGSAARDRVFAGMFAAGGVTGLMSAWLVARIPEERLPAPADAAPSLVALLRQPFADPNFRRLLRFVASWQFAVNFATPFFTVFIVRQLGFDVSVVLLLNVTSQLANLVALRGWGRLSDAYANKSVLTVSAPAYILSIVAMIGASQLGDRMAVIAWLTILHVVMGAAVAGVTLASTNIALKLSPRGSATAFVAANAVVTAVAAGTAPIVGGLMAQFFAARRLTVEVGWISPRGAFSLPLALSHWDFYFLIAGAIGLYALHRLSLVEEHGEIDRKAMVNRILVETRRTVRNISSVAGLRGASDLPASLLRDARVRVRLRRARAARDGAG